MFDPQHSGLIYFEDIVVGQPMTLGQRPISIDEIKSFARRWDPQPIHLDEAAAKVSIVGGLCASGFHTSCIMMRLLVDHFLARAASLGAPGLEETKWLKPVRPGDVLSIRIHAESKRVMASRPDVGIARAIYDVINQAGDTVLSCTCNQMIRVRDPGPKAATLGTREAKPALVNLWDMPVTRRGDLVDLYFEDRVVGENWAVGSHTFGREEVLEFAQDWDPQPFHLDEAAAKASLFGGLAASGWHTACHYLRLIVTDRLRMEAALRAAGRPVPIYGPSPGFRNLRWIKPVMVGDTLEYRTSVVGKRDLPNHPTRGLLAMVTQARNQKSELVFHYEGAIFAERRTARVG
jgi:acyl dehydratase